MTTSEKPQSRIFYIDNLRIFLIILVILHHFSITFGAPCGWYITDSKPGPFSVLLLTMFVSTNQAFFMGLFFLISAYFSPMSYNRKGKWIFLKDKLIRLGIPLIIYYFLLSPLTIFIVVRYNQNVEINFTDFYIKYQAFGFGPLWFVETLLYFSIIYFGWRVLSASFLKYKNFKIAFPDNLQIIIFSLLIGIGSFVVRIWLPVGWELKPLGLQFPHFLQYISLFVIGIIAYNNNWINSITYKKGINWFIFSQILILLLFLFIFFGKCIYGEIDFFKGGFHWESLFYSLYEQVLCVSLIMGLSGIFKQKLNKQIKFTKLLSASAYTVFIIHAPVLVVLGILLKNIEMDSLLKFVVFSPVAVISCFLVAIIIIKIPYTNKVL